MLLIFFPNFLAFWQEKYTFFTYFNFSRKNNEESHLLTLTFVNWRIGDRFQGTLVTIGTCWLLIYLMNWLYILNKGAILIVWYLDLQLPVESVPITTKVVSETSSWWRILNTRLCDSCLISYKASFHFPQHFWILPIKPTPISLSPPPLSGPLWCLC